MSPATDFQSRLRALQVNADLAELSQIRSTAARRVVDRLKPLRETLQTIADEIWAEATKGWAVEQGAPSALSQYGIAYDVWGMGIGEVWRIVPQGTRHEIIYCRDGDDIERAIAQLRDGLVKALARSTGPDDGKPLWSYDTIVLRRPFKIEADYDMAGGAIALKAHGRFHYWNSAYAKPGDDCMGDMAMVVSGRVA